MAEDHLLWTLLALFALTQVFWAVITHKLINKLMSRDYNEYSWRPEKTPEEVFVEEAAGSVPPDAQAKLDALNGVNVR